MNTIITTQGRVISQGSGGVTVVSEDYPTRAVLSIDEVSDDTTINLFIRLADINASLADRDCNDILPRSREFQILLPV